MLLVNQVPNLTDKVIPDPNYVKFQENIKELELV